MRWAVAIALACTGCRFSVDAVGNVGAVAGGDLAVAVPDMASAVSVADLATTAPADLATMPTPTPPGDLAVDPCAGAPTLGAGNLAAQCVIGNPPAIDGDLTDWPLGSFVAMTRTTAAQAAGTWGTIVPDDSNASARFFVRWDLSYLYVAVSITDDVQETPNMPPGLSDNDALEIFLDGNHDRTQSYGSDDWQLVYSADAQKAAARVTLVTWPTGTVESWGGVNPSWTLEAAIPWSALGATAAAPGRVVGFDLKLDDNDSGRTTRDRDLVQYYDGTAPPSASCSAPYCRTDVFGAVQLQGR